MKREKPENLMRVSFPSRSVNESLCGPGRPHGGGALRH